MATDSLTLDKPLGGVDDFDDLFLLEEDSDPLHSALGYEAADPALQARLWRESVLELYP